MEKIWDQKKHTNNECLRMSIVYIALVKTGSPSPLRALDFITRPLFRTMKCVDPETRSAEEKCMVFVDEFGFVYQNWEDFKLNTLYPDTIIVAPALGVFTRSCRGIVQLTSFQAPKTAAQIEREKWTGLGLTVGGLGSAAVLGTAAFFPVTAPFVWGAIGVGTVVGLVSGANSAQELFKRNKHEQDISLGNKESRAHWLAITGTTLAFAASGATSLIRSAAAVGNVSKTLLLASNTLCGASIVVNGVCVGNSIFAAFTDDRPMTALDLLQLSSSLFLFTHSVYNYQTAQRVVAETQAQHLSDYKTTLSKNGQKRFQNKMNGRVRNSGATQARGDTIRNLNSAEHYNANFRGTAAYSTSAGFVENPQLRQSLSNSFNKYAPQSMTVLVVVYNVIVRATGDEYWQLFKKMGERILERLSVQGLNLSVEDVISECFTVCQEYAQKRNITVKDVVMSFGGFTYESIPRCVREYFEVLIPTPGPQKCTVCLGCNYSLV